MTLFRQTAVAACLTFGVSFGASAADVTLRFGHDQPPGSMYDAGHVALQKSLAELSDGAIEVEVFPAAQLGAEVEMIEGMRLGSVDGAVAHVANAATVVPELGLFSVAYLFNDRDHFERVVNDPAFLERISSLVEGKDLGLKVLGVYSAGVRNIYTRKGPAMTPDDLAGTKIRVMNNPIEAKIWSTLGAIPTPMNFGEVYQALQSGVLDAAENGPAVIESNKHYEAADTIIETEHQRSVALLLMSEKKFEALSPALQANLLEAAEMAAQTERDVDAELNAAAISRMKDKGVAVVQPDKAAFAAKVAAIQDEVAAELGMTDVLELIRSHAD
jgi:tripartite ATP-independent transporter DctP family solute receptor